jgi:CDGSH-type Zn-finger protein/uncharacterized Fe-S cluster protein YjdI
VTEPSHIVIESRVQLFSSLGEAAELEHNLMCLYLYAALGLKREVSEGVTEEQLAVIDRWRTVVLGVALEEMTHLALVSNLMSALGGSPNFMRPNFPVVPGMYPADLVIELAPFDLSTIEHFIYLERPSVDGIDDGASFPHRETYHNQAPEERLMTYASDYPTVGSLYRSIREAIERLSAATGEIAMFVETTDRQLGPLEMSVPGLSLVHDLPSAVQALDTIVIQGEGALVVEGSHYARFSAIRDEYRAMLVADPTFTPGRAVARNPVMRKPITPENRVWIVYPLAAKYVDLANGVYTFMLRVLFQVYVVEGRTLESKRVLLETAVDAMHAMAAIAETLTSLPASDERPEIRAGITFAMNRNLAPLASSSETDLLSERLGQLVNGLDTLGSELATSVDGKSAHARCGELLARARDAMEGCRLRLLGANPKMPAPAPVTAPPKPRQVVETAADHTPIDFPTSTEIETARGSALTVVFDGKRCIHSRHCVTELPGVFRANIPSTWIFPDEAAPSQLAAVIRECPSGALHYVANAGAESVEAAPQVNLIRLRQNGPYAVLAQIELAGREEGMRLTLCRCGKSQNKPYCDGSHNGADFVATGEPTTIDATALPERAGILRIRPVPNGPLAVSGNLEICAGTGRVVLRTVDIRLCRCGHSQTKPICDGSHVRVGFVSTPGF